MDIKKAFEFLNILNKNLLKKIENRNSLECCSLKNKLTKE